MATLQPSEAIKNFIKSHEGLRLSPYRCAGGVWTVGYGHTDNDFSRTHSITRAQAEAFFETDVAHAGEQVNAMAEGVTLTQGQFDALVSFAFNLGIGALESSTLWRKVKANPSDPTIPAEFTRWVYAKGVRLPGLVRRRSEEAKIWQQ
ncbi:MAG: lysozyme [Bacteroides sp.]|nr:lysozyme [Bacteroides sp.]MCM1380009.1 lysozyme [Bacteroides sp.]MCM1446311.1 lysozyme [Prevotella sp.]